MMNVIVYIVLVGIVSAASSNDEKRAEEQSHLFEGDIELTTEQRAIIDEAIRDESTGPGGNNGERKARSDLSKRWPNAQVPYVIASAPDPAVIAAAIAHWENLTCIRFVPRTNQPDYVEFELSNGGCSSYVGKIGGKQRIRIAAWCVFGSVVHEIGHAIGFWHEQSRPDRDDYITVHDENIIPANANNFNRYTWSDIVTHNIPYDVGSVMHYGRFGFSVNGQATISANNPADNDKLGQRNGLSAADVKLAQAIYGCTEINLSGKPTSQSSTTNFADAARAVDGDTNGEFNGLSCTHTSYENAWWRVDLGTSTRVSDVVLYNRQDCCKERLQGAVVRIGDDPNVMNNPTCSGSVSASQINADQNIKATCNLVGRYISVNLPGPNPLTLCEVKAYYGTRQAIDLTRKATSQISTTNDASAARAVDGNTNGQWTGNSCTHTSNDNSPWWKVDLGSSSCIGDVVLFNRQDCCAERLEGAVVRIGNDANVLNNPACSSVVFPNQITASQDIQATCNLNGRYLSVNLPGQNHLTLCEVQAFQCKHEINLSGKPTSQSSTTHDALAARAVDGNTNSQWTGNSCTHTSNENSPWWRVDLGTSTQVSDVVLYNRADCCAERLLGAVVRVGDDSNVMNNPTCSGSVTAGLIFSDHDIRLTCNLNGRYLSVNLPGQNYLTLCEVKAYL